MAGQRAAGPCLLRCGGRSGQMPSGSQKELHGRHPQFRRWPLPRNGRHSNECLGCWGAWDSTKLGRVNYAQDGWRVIESMQRPRQTDAMYSFSSFVRTASSSSRLSKLNQGSSDNRGRSDGNVVAILNFQKTTLTSLMWSQVIRALLFLGVQRPTV